MKTISSIYNDEIKEIVKLHSSKGRKEQQRFIAEGLRVCSTMIQAGLQPIALYATLENMEKGEQLSSPDFVTLVSHPVMNKITASTTASGILGIFPIKQTSLNNLESGLVLYNISDPGNMGTLMRTCAAMGKKNIVIIEGADPYNPKVVQSSAGTLGLLNLIQCSWDELVKNKGDLKLCALVVKGGKKPDSIDFSQTLFIVGNEAHGIPDHVVNQSDLLVTLPMPSSVESLNVAVAGSIALYIAWHTAQ